MMSTGSKLIIGVLAFSIITPILSLLIVRNNRFVYHSYRPDIGADYFVQVFYQSLPKSELNYIVCAKKPIQIDFATTVDLIPRIIDYQYYLLPRGIFYRNSSATEPQNSIFKHKNILSQTWRQARNRQLKFFFLENGKCIKIPIDSFKQSDWQDKENFSQTQLWKALKIFIDNNN